MIRSRIPLSLLTVLCLSGIAFSTHAQYTFTDEITIPVTPVKDQHRSGTCWCFATVSFLEAELIRTGKGEHDLSEMFYVRDAYSRKADKYVRMHGKNNFGGGGLAMDVLESWKIHGVIPQEAYPGHTTADSLPVHGELDGVLKGYIDQVIKNRNRTLSTAWKPGFEGILDAYMGEVPEEFEYRGSRHTPRSLAEELELDPADYIPVGSFTHHPFYKPFILEVPDNWDWGMIQNVPLDELMEILDHALENGYTVCWDADVGEKGFDWKSGIALIPSTEIEDLSGLERARWDDLSEQEQQALFYDFTTPKKEREITQEIRQEWFDNYQTTDDHLMHITGTATGPNGKRFYRVKNSWGTGNHIHEGYLFVSESYMRAKTLFFLVHRDAVPEPIATRMGG